MRVRGWVRRRLDVLLRKESMEAELDDELRFHLEMEIRERIAEGASPEEARRDARIAFGGVERTKEEVRDVRGAREIDDWLQDTRIALRSFLKEPAFLVTMLLTLGLGIGGNVAMLGILEASLLRTLPYPDPERLVLGRVTYEGRIGRTVSGPDFYDYRDQATTLSGLAAYTPFELQATWTGSGEAERVLAPYASPDFFATLGVEPFLGRTFSPEEGEPGAAAVALLSHGFWQARFGSAPDALGRTLVLDGTPTTVVGVLPRSFRFDVPGDLWRPMIRGGPFAGARQYHNWMLVGRLAPGASLSQAGAEVDGISARLSELYPASNRDKGLALTPLREAVSARYRPTLILLGVATALLLVIACANVGGVLLARGSGRRSEMAIRSSLGAGRGRLLRQFLAEGALLVVASAALGTALAGWIQVATLRLVSLDDVAGVETGLSLAGIGLAVLAAATTVAVFGALPAALSARSGEASELRRRSGTSGGVAAARFRSGLVVFQVTLTVVLMMMSGLLVRSLLHLYDVETGFDAERLLTAEVHLPPGKYQDVAKRPIFYSRLRELVAEVPGVEAVGLVNMLPVRDPGNNVRVARPAEWGRGGVFGQMAYQRMVLPGYFETMGIPILLGRDVSSGDRRDGSNVMILSEYLAEALFPDQSPLGRELGVDVGADQPWVAEVVGVVGDVAAASLEDGKDVTMYFAYGQRSPASMRLAVRTASDPATVTGTIRHALHGLDPDVPLAAVAPMEEVLAASVSDRRAVMALLGTFATMALLLAAIGLYGVLAHQVSRRTQEIGVRMALGSSVARVVGAVVRSGFLLVAIGLLLGVPASIFAARQLRGLLFEVGPGDPVPYLGAALILGAVGALACLLPARRAACVDPAVVFRTE
ncbi:MAG TPA: ABC transporter permease [Thermoanaerobaculia bacterium]|nr:ABC transporter permease [Thermoanaerobaculia bacterium]